MANISEREQQELVSAVIDVSRRNDWNPSDMLTIMSFETGGKLDPWTKGPTTQWGTHRGLIQWGQPQAKEYGVTKDTSIAKQVEAVADYMTDRGVKRGDDILSMYAAVNAGHASKKGARDAHNGGTWGTVEDKVNHQMGGHRDRANSLIAQFGPNPATMNQFATAFSVSPNVTATSPAIAAIDGLIAPSYVNRDYAPVATPTPAPRGDQTRGYGALANSLSNAEWAGTNLSGTNFGLPAGYTSQVAQRDIVQAAPVEPVTRGGSLPDIATTIDPGRLGAVTNASSTLAAAAPQVATGASALSTTAPATGLLDSIALGAAPVGQPAPSLASTATGATNTASNSPANAYGALASSLSQAGLTNLSGTTQTQAPSVVTAAPVSTPAPAPAATTPTTMTTQATKGKPDADFRSGRPDRAALDPDPNAKDQTKISIAPTVGRVAGGLLGSMVAGPIGGLLGATLGGKIGSGELGLGGLLGSMTENTEAFSIDNPSGSGRGLLDVSKGPVSIGSLTATAAPNSGGYRSVDSNTGWTSYTSPLGITTTMVGDNIVGGPGLSPAAGGNAAGFK